MNYVLILGPIFFVVVSIILGYITPGYSYKTNYISELSLKKYGWIQKINFLISGIMIILLCFSVSKYAQNQFIKIGWYLGMLIGVSLFLTGIFDTDFGLSKRNLSGKIHGFIYQNIGVPVMGLVYLMLGLGYISIKIIAILSWVFAIFSFIIYKYADRFRLKQGVAQRIVIFLAVFWLEILAVMTFSR